MSKVFYFQRYSQRENWLTNSTLLLLSRLQHYSRGKFQEALRIIAGADDELKVGFYATQQVKGEASIPDGLLEQQAFRIVIEAKLYDNFSAGQLSNHLDLFKDYSGKCILLGLSKHGIERESDISLYSKVKELADQKGIQVSFKSLSYLSLIESIDSVLGINDEDLKEILEDYRLLCQEAGVIDRKNETMLVVASGTSLEENLEYKIYYDPVERNHNIHFKYMALYAEKSIKAIGEVEEVISCWYDPSDGQLKSYDTKEPIKLEEDARNKITDIIKNTNYYQLEKGSKFFLLKDFHLCNIPYPPIRQKKYEYLSEHILSFCTDMQVSELKEKLKDAWKEN